MVAGQGLATFLDDGGASPDDRWRIAAAVVVVSSFATVRGVWSRVACVCACVHVCVCLCACVCLCVCAHVHVCVRGVCCGVTCVWCV